MTGESMERTPPEMLQGTVDLLVLRALAGDPMHGYAVSRWLEARSNGVLVVDGAALYQALHRLERRGWVASTWGVSENNRRAKFYRLTRRGSAHLRATTIVWHTYAHAVARVLVPQ
jgi:PadR family transcriptional regulator